MQFLREWWVKRTPHFRTEVRIEAHYLREVHGQKARERALERGHDPHLRFFHRLVALEAAKALQTEPLRDQAALN